MSSSLIRLIVLLVPARRSRSGLFTPRWRSGLVTTSLRAPSAAAAAVVLARHERVGVVAAVLRRRDANHDRVFLVQLVGADLRHRTVIEADLHLDRPDLALARLDPDNPLASLL